MLKHYVEFLYPGLIVSESEEREVPSRDYKDLKKIPKNCFGFRFFDRVENTVDDEILYGQNKNYSKMYYPKANKYSLSEVKEQFPDHNILISNMKNNGWKYVVRTRHGNF